MMGGGLLTWLLITDGARDISTNVLQLLPSPEDFGGLGTRNLLFLRSAG